MKVAFITTINHNVGDDFVRAGIMYLLSRVIAPFEPAFIHKHLPITSRPEWAWLQGSRTAKLLDRIPHLGVTRCAGWIDALPLRATTDKILSSSLVVQSGAPVYWLSPRSDCSRNEWYKPLVSRRWKRIASKVPLLNLGAGACQSYYSDGSEFLNAPATLAYIREFHAACALTTVRDSLSATILREAGLFAPVLPCPSIFARRWHGLAAETGQYVILNYMKSGGHFELDDPIDPAIWRDMFVRFARELARHQRCLVVSHNQSEWAEAVRILPEMEHFHSANYEDYLRVYAGANGGVVNRVHAGFAIASFGKPVLVVGNDSRARMTELLGLPNRCVSDVSLEILQEEWARLAAKASEHALRLQELCAKAEKEYLDLLAAALPTHLKRPSLEHAVR